MNKVKGARCSDCPLQMVEGVVPGYGPKDAEVIFIGEAPGVNEQAQGVPFVGQSGMLLDAALDQCGANPDTFIYKTNVIACRPPNNRPPTEQEIACCRGRLKNELSQVLTKKIVTLGKTAHEEFGVPYTQIGAVFPVIGREVMPCWHPAYILRAPDKASEFMKCIDRAVNGPFTTTTPDPDVHWVHTATELRNSLEQCPDGAWVGVDIETDNVKWYDDPDRLADSILMMQLAWDESFAVVVPDDLLYDDPECREILQAFLGRVQTVGHNLKFDAVFLKTHLGITFKQHFDTMLAHYLIDENSSHGLKAVSSLWLGIPDYEKDTVQPYLRTRNDSYSKVPPDVLAKYGAMDVVVVLKLREVFEKLLHKEDMYETPFMEIIMPAANMLVDTEIHGMMVDLRQIEWLSSDEAFGGEIEHLAQEVRDLSGKPNLNPNSHVQMAEVLYDDLKLPIPSGRKIKPRSVGNEAREKLWGKHPIIEVFDKYKRVHKMHSSYVQNLHRYLDVNNRVHATFNIPGTEVGRLSVSRPALQTIPRASDYYGAMIRSAFIAAPGRVLVICDYSQAELRVFAAESNEPFLIRVYQEGRDLHSEVAIGMYGDGFTKEQRVQCKMFNFSYLYGGTEYSFAQDAGLDIGKAKEFVRNYNALMPVGLKWKKDQLEKLRKDGYVVTRFHRRRRFPLLVDGNIDDARKACVHMPIASAANDLTLLSGIKLADMGYDVVLMVHDSVILEVDANKQEDAVKDVERVMLGIAMDRYPEVAWKVDAEVRLRWAEPRQKS